MSDFLFRVRLCDRGGSMNVIPFSDCQDERLDPIGQRVQSLKIEVGELYGLSFRPEVRDALIKDLGNLSEICLALQLIWSRVKARQEA